MLNVLRSSELYGHIGLKFVIKQHSLSTHYSDWYVSAKCLISKYFSVWAQRKKTVLNLRQMGGGESAHVALSILTFVKGSPSKLFRPYRHEVNWLHLCCYGLELAKRRTGIRMKCFM